MRTYIIETNGPEDDEAVLALEDAGIMVRSLNTPPPDPSPNPHLTPEEREQRLALAKAIEGTLSDGDADALIRKINKERDGWSD